MPDFADQLIAELDAATQWPLPRERRAISQALEGRAFRKGDHAQLAQAQGWDIDRTYVVDPLARRIAFGFADFLFGEDPQITTAAASEADQAELDQVVDENKLPARLHRAERLAVSEGEAWWKIHTNLAVADVPLITWVSRRHVVPLLYGDRVLAAGFVTERARECGRDEKGQPDEQEPDRVWRQIEIHTDKRVVNVLYLGSDQELGRRVPLDSRPETAGYAEVTLHGLPMLAGRVVNDFDDDETVGVSEYESVKDLLYALNEAVTIATENARLTGQDRVFVAGRFTQADGSFDASLQVFQVETDGATLGEGQGSLPIMGIEKHYQAEPLWFHIDKLVRTVLRDVGMVAQLVGGDDREGAADSGTAIRLRFLPTSNAARGKMREWQPVIPHLLSLMLQLIKLPITAGGFGRSVVNTDPPVVEYGDPIPRDESEETRDQATAVTAGIMSRRTAITERHPDWQEDQVDEELEAIRADESLDPPASKPPVPVA